MSIRVKIFVYLLIFCSALLAVLWLFQVVFLDSIYKEIKIGEVKSAMKTMSAEIENPNFPELADNLFQTQSISTELVLSNGSLVYSSEQNDYFRLRDSAKEIPRLWVMTRQNDGEYFEYPNQTDAQQSDIQPIVVRGGTTRTSAQQSKQAMYYCKSVLDGGLIILSALISPVDSTIETLRIELYFVTVFMILFALILALLIARNVSKPIISINSHAKSTLAAGKYEADFRAGGYREIRELADTLNIAAKELATVDELRKELVANVSHDLRTPLTLIAGYAEAMRDLPGENTPENAQIIVDETNRLNRLVSEVLSLSKLQSGVLETHTEPYNLTQTLRGIVERLAEFTKANGYTVLFEAERDLIITADEAQISQAVYNLLTNAINFTGEDKTVILRQVENERQSLVRIEVADSGKGIPQEEIPRIWDRYYRTGNKHRRAVIGSGIGLSIVKSIAELHGGNYGVISEADKGSVFWIEIPYAVTRE